MLVLRFEYVNYMYKLQSNRFRFSMLNRNKYRLFSTQLLDVGVVPLRQHTDMADTMNSYHMDSKRVYVLLREV